MPIVVAIQQDINHDATSSGMVIVMECLFVMERKLASTAIKFVFKPVDASRNSHPQRL